MSSNFFLVEIGGRRPANGDSASGRLRSCRSVPSSDGPCDKRVPLLAYPSRHACHFLGKECYFLIARTQASFSSDVVALDAHQARIL